MNSTIKTANIIVVDDDPLNLQLVTHTLARAGFATAVASDGDEALNLISTGEFDAVVSDVRMPRLSGIELLQNIRARFPSLPVILMTGLIEDDIREAALSWNATALFEKPVNGGDLILTIRLALRESARPHADCEVVGSV
jgi:DNA-binding response OmpR family regulator